MVEIVNETKGFVISGDAQMRDTMEGRRRGLMGSERKDLILAVPGHNRLYPMIHMFGMRYPIDVVWVDREMKVVDVRRGIVPSRLSKPRTWTHMPRAPAKYVVEIALGQVKDTEIGDRLAFRPQAPKPTS
jgi:uncharacterized protein